MDIILCTDKSANNQSGKIATTTKGECFYSEISSTNHPREQASSVGFESEHKSAVTSTTSGSGYQGLAGEHEDPWTLQEALYDQPVCLNTQY